MRFGKEPDCADTPTALCHDMNRFVVASGISIPPIHFQNRPTFQQTVSVRRGVR